MCTWETIRSSTICIEDHSGTNEHGNCGKVIAKSNRPLKDGLVFST